MAEVGRINLVTEGRTDISEGSNICRGRTNWIKGRSVENPQLVKVEHQSTPSNVGLVSPRSVRPVRVKLPGISTGDERQPMSAILSVFDVMSDFASEMADFAYRL